MSMLWLPQAGRHSGCTPSTHYRPATAPRCRSRLLLASMTCGQAWSCLAGPAAAVAHHLGVPETAET